MVVDRAQGGLQAYVSVSGFGRAHSAAAQYFTRSPSAAPIGAGNTDTASAAVVGTATQRTAGCGLYRYCHGERRISEWCYTSIVKQSPLCSGVSCCGHKHYEHFFPVRSE